MPVKGVEQERNTFGMGVGNKNLTEAPVFDIIQDLAHAAGVQLIENIVEQEDGRIVFARKKHVGFGQSKSNEEGFLLALAAEFFDGVAVERKNQVVAMDAVGCVLEQAVAFKVFLEEFVGCGLVECRTVGNAGLFAGACDTGIFFGQNRCQALNKLLSFGMDCFGIAGQGPVEGIQAVRVERSVGGKIFEQAIALAQAAGVANQVVEVVFVVLGDKPVGESPAGFAAFADQVAVVGRDHHHGDKADIVAEPGVFFPVDRKGFLFAFTVFEQNVEAVVITVEPSFDAEKILAVSNQLAVGQSEVGFAHCQGVNGIQQIGFAHAVVSRKGIDLRMELGFEMFEVFEIIQCQFVKLHDSNNHDA